MQENFLKILDFLKTISSPSKSPGKWLENDFKSFANLVAHEKNLDSKARWFQLQENSETTNLTNDTAEARGQRFFSIRRTRMRLPKNVF